MTEASRRRIQFCTFDLCGRLFGVNILDVKEVNTETALTPVYHAPPQVRGYVNIRGQIHLILDLRLLLGYPETPITAASRLVLFKESAGESFGVLVDRIDDVVEVGADELEDRRKTSRGDAPGHEHRRDVHAIGMGVCRLKDRLMVALNARNMLKGVERLKTED